MHEDDLRLAKRFAAGDQEAATSVVSLYLQDLVRLFVSLGQTEDDAKDLVQETLVKARFGAAKYRGESSLKTWIYRIAIRQHGMAVRKMRWTRPLENLAGKIPENPEVGPNGIALWVAVRELSDKLRTVFVLHEVVGLTTAEVAEMIEIPVGTVTSRLFNARLRLREVLGDELEDHQYAREQLNES